MPATQTKKPLNSRMQRKIAHLQRLIAHERTSVEERDAATRALRRINDAYAITPAEQPVGTRAELTRNPGAWTGEKYESARSLTLTEIAKRIRADLKLARKVGRASAAKDGDVAILDPIGDAPREITFSVRTSYYSGGGSIDVTVKNVPEGWGWTWAEDQSYRDGRVRVATPAMAALRQEVERIHSAYNYDNSDSQTDYFERRYYGSVGIDPWLRFPRY